jgi:hypothetical protein
MNVERRTSRDLRFCRCQGHRTSNALDLSRLDYGLLEKTNRGTALLTDTITAFILSGLGSASDRTLATAARQLCRWLTPPRGAAANHFTGRLSNWSVTLGTFGMYSHSPEAALSAGPRSQSHDDIAFEKHPDQHERRDRCG